MFLYYILFITLSLTRCQQDSLPAREDSFQARRVQHLGFPVKEPYDLSYPKDLTIWRFGNSNDFRIHIHPRTSRYELVTNSTEVQNMQGDEILMNANDFKNLYQSLIDPDLGNIGIYGFQTEPNRHGFDVHKLTRQGDFHVVIKQRKWGNLYRAVVLDHAEYMFLISHASSIMRYLGI